jgi:hypothetical protein
MSPFEDLYCIKFNTLVIWENAVNKVVLGLGLLKDMEDQMVIIKNILKETQDR